MLPRYAEQSLCLNTFKLFLHVSPLIHVFRNERFALSPFRLGDSRPRGQLGTLARS